MVGPELLAQLHGILGIGCRSRQIAQGLGIKQLERVLVDRAVSDIVGIHFLVGRVGGEADEFFSCGLVWRTLWNYPVIQCIYTAAPDHLEVLAFALCGIDTAVVGRCHHHITGYQILCRQRACIPPLNIWLELVQFLEGTIYTSLGAKDLVDILGRYAVSHKGKFQRELGALLHAAFAWVFLVSQKSTHPCGAVFSLSAS